MFDLIQLLALVFVGGLVAGEVAFRYCSLPRVIGYVLLGILVGQSVFGWLEPEHIDSAQLLIDLALGFILFELGYSAPQMPFGMFLKRLISGTDIAMATGLSIVLALLAWGFSLKEAAFSAALCLATSPAITMVTCSDMGAKGEKTSLLYMIVSINSLVAFIALAFASAFLLEHDVARGVAGLWLASQRIWGALVLGGACCGIALMGSELLGRKLFHQKILILGIVILGINLTEYLDVLPMLPMLAFGFMTRAFDRDNNFVATRISSDARILLIVSFVFAGATLDIANLIDYWPEAVFLVMSRFCAQGAAAFMTRNALGLTAGEAVFLAIGLQPLSSVALLMLGSTQALHISLDPRITGTLLAAILLMQVMGPLATKISIIGFGEAHCGKADATCTPKSDRQ